MKSLFVFLKTGFNYSMCLLDSSKCDIAPTKTQLVFVNTELTATVLLIIKLIQAQQLTATFL